MKLCFIVDYRSPIARNWINYFVEEDHDVNVLSTFPYHDPTPELSSFHFVPIGFSSVAGNSRLRQLAAVNEPSTGTLRAELRELRRAGKKAGSMARQLRLLLAPLDAHRQKYHVRAIIREISPDLVHAMRIPFEGILAAAALTDGAVPLLTSVWGNDFTLFASQYHSIARATRGAMRYATALHADCHRDVRLAHEWGFSREKSTIVLPGSGGVQPELFYPSSSDSSGSERTTRERWGIPAGRPVVFNPRSFRPSYVCNDTFFDSIPLVQAECPDAVFVCVGMAGNALAEARKNALPMPDSLHLLPSVRREEMAELFRMAHVTVSPSLHDGTPNTLLEAMACGAFPVVGDIESVREWLTHEVNGLFCDPQQRTSLASALVRAIKDSALRERAAGINQRLISERAEYGKVMSAAFSFYERIVDEHRHVSSRSVGRSTMVN